VDAERRTPVHFLHFGKTGGTALKDGLAKVAQEKSWLRLHNHSTRLLDISPGEQVIFFLRDPITRFVSGFYSRQRQGQPRYFSPWSSAEAAAFSVFRTANELGEALSSENDVPRASAQMAMRAIEHVRDSYWRWLGNPEILGRRSGDIFFIGQQENLADDAKALAKLLGVAALDLPDDDVRAHRNPANVDKTLSPEALANLQRWYQPDFQAIELCRELARRAGFGGSLANKISDE